MSFHSVRTLLLTVLVVTLAACGKSSDQTVTPSDKVEKAETETKTFSSIVSGSDMPDLAKKHNCSACHSINKKVVGPAWMDVAKKYKGDAGAKDKLVAKTIKGGSGVWGAMPMPPTQRLSEADAGALVDFILGLAK